ncbi:hypothetical protein GCM10017667_52760 [Streptomyces filamentosus]|uniref:Uncharacterized protein n=1 Tax=Streptomyces filamentosus TaxID=67294 RepID=A0A919BTW7_STRFL|nr:hypothetical protein GCM10017667_52760 [Streptomyces filamentosus]
MLRSYARLADRAVPAVSNAWGRGWAREIVILVPGSLDGMDQLLGAPASGYRASPPVTTGEAGGSGAAPADRVIINPRGVQGARLGRQAGRPGRGRQRADLRCGCRSRGARPPAGGRRAGLPSAARRATPPRGRGAATSAPPGSGT